MSIVSWIQKQMGITPATALNFMKLGLEKDCGHPISCFHLIYISEPETLYFQVQRPAGHFDKLAYADGKSVIAQTKSLLMDRIKAMDTKISTGTIDGAALTYQNNSWTIQVKYRDEQGNKIDSTFPLT